MKSTKQLNVRSTNLIIFGIVLVLQIRISAAMDDKISVADLESKVDKFVKAGMACRRNTGLSLSVVRAGEVVLAKGYGHKTTEKLEPVTNTTLFGIASLSKSFAAVLLLKLIEEHDKYVDLL